MSDSQNFGLLLISHTVAYMPLSNPWACNLSQDIINAATEHSKLML